MSARDSLEIEFIGDHYEVPTDQTLVFGRGAELDIDENPYLHRRLGRFEHRDGMWFLCNVGRSLHISILDRETQTQATVAPGRELALTFTPATVRFRAGRSTYELLITSALSPLVELESAHTWNTTTSSSIPLTPDQRLLIIVLAERTLRDPTAGIQIPPSKEAAGRLGWSLTKFNRKLDNVCAKLTKAGVARLHGGAAKLASNRRRVLVEFAVQSGLVTSSDLESIDAGQ